MFACTSSQSKSATRWSTLQLGATKEVVLDSSGKAVSEERDKEMYTVSANEPKPLKQETAPLTADRVSRSEPF